MRSAPAIGFDLRPSSRLALVRRLMLLLVWLALAMSALPWWQPLGGGMLAAALYWRAWRGDRALPLRALTWSEGEWRAIKLSGEDIPIRLLHWRAFGSYRWLYLEYAEEGRHGLLLGPDNLDADSLRQLRMRLLDGRGGAAAL